MKSIIALGANLGDRETNFVLALKLLGDQVGCIAACSRFYETNPINHPDNPNLVQPQFLNAVAIVDTDLQPLSILEGLQLIENKIGRNRDGLVAEKWGPRVIDLDIIAIESLRILRPNLIVPHPEMHKRSFVLEPMCELWPTWRHPILGKTAAALLEQLHHPISS